MSNALTGDYDAVFEVNTTAIDRVLATIHQNGASPDASPTLLHSIGVRVGDVAILPPFELAERFLLENFGGKIADIAALPRDALHAVQQDLLDTQKAAQKTALDIDKIISPGASGEAASIVGGLVDIAVVRGMAQVQVGTLALSLPPGSTTEVVVHADIRAAYAPDPGTGALPAPIHGQVQAAFTINYDPAGKNGKPAFKMKPSSDKSKIAFIPAPGTLTAAQAGQITRELRRFMISKFGDSSVAVPEGFKFTQFKNLVAGGIEAIALPVQLSDGALPASALGSVTNLFLNSNDDFAIAISKDYITNNLLQPLLQQINTAIAPQSFDVWLVGGSVSISGAGLEFKPGVLTAVAAVHLHLWVWNPFGDDQYYDWDFNIMQDLALTVSADGTLSLYRPPGAGVYLSDNAPTFAGDAKEWVEQAKQQIGQALDVALNSPEFHSNIASALTRLPFKDAFSTFDSRANITFTALEITTDGVVLRGSTSAVGARPDVFVEFSETPSGSALTAFKSWIPAGTIDRFVWTWVTRSGLLPWSGTVKELPSPHSFLFRWGAKPGQKPAEVMPPPWQTGEVCLAVEGRQVGWASGTTISVSGSASSYGSSGTCSLGKPEWLAVSPSWWTKLLMIPYWTPDPPWEAALDLGIAAHFNVRPEVAPATEARASVLVHFADHAQAPLPPLSEAMHRSKHRDAGVPVIVVLPRGAFAQTRSAVEASLGSFRSELAIPLAITEDYEGSWTQAFNASGGAATCLLGPDGEIAWKHQGHLDAAGLAAALDQHVVAPRLRRSHLLRTALRVGARAPDFLYGHGQGRHLRGRPLLLLFWKSWSTPCINELVRLQKMHRRTGGRGRVVVAIGDGEDDRRTAEVVREHRLGFLVVPDPNRQIARQCAINCWPTLVAIREDGLVSAIHHGATHPPRAPVAAAVTV